MVSGRPTGLPRYQRLVDGLVLPVALAGHPSLDFCNTLAGWGSAEPREYLATYAHLAVWAREAGLVAAATAKRLCESAELDPTTAAGALERARSMRAALYAAWTDPSASAAWDAVAEEARAAAAASVLVRQAPPGARWVILEETGLILPVLGVARVAGDLLATTDFDRVGRCPGAGCGWLFLRSNGRRRWCSMAVCGNRAKARRHAERTQHIGASG